MKQYLYRRKRPSLVIEITGGRQLGNCYAATYYRVTSCVRLRPDQLEALNRAGLLGIGQEFAITGKQEPAGEDVDACVVVDDATGKVLDEAAVNPYTSEPYPPVVSHFHTYDCESRADSGD